MKTSLVSSAARSAVLACALSLCAAPAFAAGPAHTSPLAQPSAAPQAAAPDAVTHHTVVIGGRTIAYTARAGTITLRNGKDQPTARVFYVAYTEDGENAATRPVTFLYNGGPGSSTIWLRMGSFGPVRVVTSDGTATGPPPYRIVENNDSLLDKTDLVFIDMPDSGFGRIIGAGTPKEFFGVDQDIAAFGQFIQRYLTTFARWNSPKFLFGESYGTTRSAGLADWLVQNGVALNGVVLQSSILSFGLDFNNGDPIATGDWAYVFYLPTEAATAWYHNKIRNKPANLDDYLSGVEHFAMGEYANALAKGATLDAATRNDVVRKLSSYLGVSEQYVRSSNLRIPYFRFEDQLLRGSGEIVGRLDSRFTTHSTDRAADQPNYDPTDSAIDAAFTATNEQYLRQDLKYDTQLQYRTQIYNIIYANGSSWDFKHNGREPTNVAPDLADAMTQNPNLKVFSANGYYDFATPFFATMYTLNHLNIAPSLQKNITYGFYDSGHMIYLHPAALDRFKADLANWYDSTLGH